LLSEWQAQSVRHKHFDYPLLGMYKNKLLTSSLKQRPRYTNEYERK